ncbi:hypothetical protein EJV47_18565 [Hymenobacter gummosus]|uniref:LPXTG cell wall anchor domain-containing protein n=1 Tax=Hymenobacter gummosus TaxID=1776032 RepID=A0A3S0J8I7_9BACT|nr:hypothetical protein [Hymenobacter gummosus]RTQ47920.1 hypothetical protein EJV47_18565 [Hymenobacter gummosus]
MRSVVACVLAALACPTFAQTARNTPLGRRAKTPEAAATGNRLDSVFVIHRVRQLSDTSALQYGHWQHLGGAEDTLGGVLDSSIAEQRQPLLATFKKQEWPRMVERYREYQIDVTLLSPDSVRKAPVLPPKPAGKPVLDKRKTKRKKSALVPAAPAPPHYPGMAWSVGFVAVLSGAGWLLYKRPRPQVI